MPSSLAWNCQVWGLSAFLDRHGTQLFYDSTKCVNFNCLFFHTFSGDQMFVPVWEAVYRLENMVSRFWLCDGLAANRGLFSLHKPGSTTPVNKVLKPHAHDGEKRYLWFLSDAPHLMKTVRNSWANCKRKLWVSMLSFLLFMV